MPTDLSELRALRFSPRYLAWILGDRELAAGLYLAARAWPGRSHGRREAAERLDGLVAAALAAVGAKVEEHPRMPLFRQLIRDDRKLSMDQVLSLLEFIYSYMVNRFKGDLAEILALGAVAPLVRDLTERSRLPPDCNLELACDCPTSDGSGWAKGPDGLLCAEGIEHRLWQGASSNQLGPRDDDLVVYGILEVKSYPLSIRRATAQFNRHLSRLRRGVRVGKRSWPADRVWLSTGEPPLITVRAGDSSSLQPRSLLVIPRLSRTARSPNISDQAIRLTLPFGHERLMAAAYCMTEWFAGQLGARVFEQDGSPWPEMSLEKAGFNRLKEALYHTLQDVSVAYEEASGSSERKRLKRGLDIATPLYNAYGWGLAEARRHRGMLWSMPDEAGGESRLEELDLTKPGPPTAPLEE